jgi:hypothetical protein
MKIINVNNTREIPGKQFVGVQAASDEAATAALTVIAQRRGVSIQTVYRWGNPEQPYYYAVIA